MKNLIRNNRLAAYLIFAFVCSWSWWIGLVLSTPADAFTNGNLPPTFFIFALLGGFGPSISGIATSLITGGKTETGSLFSSIKKTTFGIKWWAMAILTVPLLTLAQTGLQALTGRIVTYNVSGIMMIMGFIWPLFPASEKKLAGGDTRSQICRPVTGSFQPAFILGELIMSPSKLNAFKQIHHAFT